MNNRQSLNWAQNNLKSNFTNSADLDAEILLSYVIKKNKTFLYSHPEYQLTPTQSNKFKKLIQRRQQGEPVAYLIGHKEFYGLDFTVNKQVLIPRPETELIVETILKNKKIKTIADIGTGSGAIAISLAKNNSQLKIYATDISGQALRVAKKNALRYKINRQVIFKKGNLLKALKNIKLDAICANLPYLDAKLKYTPINKPASIGLKFEPTIALYSQHNGLAAYHQLIIQTSQLKHRPSYIYLEIGQHQTNQIKKIIRQYLPKAKISIKKDLAGLNRLIVLSL